MLNPNPLFEISNELAAFLGKEIGTKMSRQNLHREVNQYIRDNKLQDSNNSRQINFNADIKSLFKLNDYDVLDYFNIGDYMNIHFTKNQMTEIEFKYEKQSNRYPFELPMIECKLHLENQKIDYDVTCLTNFEKSFDDYIANHPIGNLFPFKKELIMKNMTGTFECLRNQARIDQKYQKEYQKEYILFSNMGTPERGYCSRIIFYPDFIDKSIGDLIL
jgi:hypothetical protein